MLKTHRTFDLTDLARPDTGREDYVIGSRCEDPAKLASVGRLARPPQHVGCPGVWNGTFDNRSARCACACHSQEPVA